MPYTWEQVQLGMDVTEERRGDTRTKFDIAQMQTDEAEKASLYSLIGTAILYPFLGPLAPFVGKTVGTYVADVQHPWEEMELDPGKFDKTEDIIYQERLDKTAKDQNWAQVVDTVTNLAGAYISAGGLKEEFRGDWGDWTSFGTGGVEGGEWSFFGDEGIPAERFQVDTAKILTPDPSSSEYYSDLLKSSKNMYGKVERVGVPIMDYTTAEGVIPGIWQSGVGLKSNISNLYDWWNKGKEEGE
jgi:hypothetical protein